MVSDYLKRISVDVAGRAPTLELLTELQTAHLIAIPFENLDVFHRRGVTTDTQHSLAKIVTRRGGGWCFELNGAFGWLLSELGYQVDYVSCRVDGPDGWGPPLDHCALVVHLDGQRYFVDVGFGDCCMIPVPLTDGEHPGVPRAMRCRVDGDQFTIGDRALDGTWHDQLWCSFEPRQLAEFTPRSDFLQTEPGLSWTAKPFATRATAADGSRITFRGQVFRSREGGAEFEERTIAPWQSDAVLVEQFGLVDTFEPSAAG
jgi:N-hydroxyarylamine O-acetyltransferase